MKTIMKNLKHLFAVLLLLCATVATAHDFAVGGIYYNITSTSDLTVEVTCQGDSYDSFPDEYSSNVVIPESVTYNGSTYRVTSVGHAAFAYCGSLASIEIPNSITSHPYSKRFCMTGCVAGFFSIVMCL